jgi:phosphoribosylaminoimidazole-succinocarboxamide synthase
MSVRLSVNQTSIPGVPVKRGKVRDVYDLGQQLLLVATDRISAFDYILPSLIPEKGAILTEITRFWFDWSGVRNHLISTDLDLLPAAFQPYRDQLDGRSMIVVKCDVAPFECVVRGYLAGSGWKEYQKTKSVCGLPLRDGLRQSEKLDQPIFTPATKAEEGHDENVPFEFMVEKIGLKLAEDLRSKSIDLYSRAADYAATKGILIADTKFEWGLLPTGEVILIDEVLTPDSSRFWPVDEYEPGRDQASFDKQYVRNWLESSSWDKNSPPPELPAEVVAGTRLKYLEAFRRLTGREEL